VGIIMVNKQLMANYGFSFGLYPFCWLPLLLLLLLLLLPCVCVSSDHWLMLSCPLLKDMNLLLFYKSFLCFSFLPQMGLSLYPLISKYWHYSEFTAAPH
jgi:hypothetical protein